MERSRARGKGGGGERNLCLESCIKRLDKNLIKFDSKSDEAILLGYVSTKKAYRCYNLRLHKIVESADVKVDDIKIIGILVRDR